MDYKYIEQLLDRYWECHTTAEEETILRSFFSQADLPEHLAQYKPLFDFAKQEQQVKLGADFDARFSDLLDAEATAQEARHTHVRPLRLRQRFVPLLKAAATVAILFTIGTAAERAIVGSQTEENATQPVLTDTYVPSSQVEAVLTPATTDATATAQPSDTLAHTVLPAESEVVAE